MHPGALADVTLPHTYTTTPLQLVDLAPRITTGREVIPHIRMNDIVQGFPEIHVHLNIVQKAIFDVVNSKTGVALTYRKSGFSGLEVGCWPLVPKFAGSNPAEAVELFRAKKSSARLPS